VSPKKWLENENDLDDDEFELPILKYDANWDTLVEKKKRTLLQEEEDPITPLQLTSEEGEDLKNKDEDSFGSCNRVIINLWHQVKGGSYVQDCRSTHK
jgi:hypothetical protein